MEKTLQALLALYIVFTLTACAQSPQLEAKPSTEFADQGLHPVSSSGFASAYARPDANLPSYQVLNIEALDLSDIDISSTPMAGTLRRNWQMTPEREQALQQVWAGAMDSAFRAYQRDASGAKVLRISTAMKRVAPGRPTATTVGGGAQHASRDVVEIFMEFRLYDQASGELLAVLRDSRTMLSQAMTRTAPVAVQTMFNSWAALLHTRVSGR